MLLSLRMMCRLALRAAAAFAAIGTAIWVEYIRPGDNPADVLSRGALDDPEAVHRLASGEWALGAAIDTAVPRDVAFDDTWPFLADERAR